MRDPRSRATLHLAVRTKLGQGIRRAEIERRLERMMTALNLHDTELSVVLTDDDQIRQLNHRYRKKNRPTDVLAFSLNAGEGVPRLPAAMPRLMGDVIVSVETARKQANKAGQPLLDELSMLLAHGILHLLGWDHTTRASDEAMRRETARLQKAAVQRVQRRHKLPRKLS
jgi:probable rRNA maturation factor